MKTVSKIIPVIALIALAGCDNMTPREQRTLSGAAIGTIGGAAIGGIIGGGKGAGIGALIGAGTGAVAGSLSEDRYYDDY